MSASCLRPLPGEAERGSAAQSHGIKGATTSEPFEEQCLTFLTLQIFDVQKNLHKTQTEGENGKSMIEILKADESDKELNHQLQP